MRVLAPLLLASAAAWLVVATTASGAAAGAPVAHHVAHIHGHQAGILAWTLMLPAMMLPLLQPPLLHVRARSLARRRARASAEFLAAYFLVWLGAGPVVISFASTLYPLPRALAVAVVLGAAVLWQCSPFKQACLNRCHSRGELSAFGWAADLDAFLYGLKHALWCVASCWPLMLIPLVTEFHLTAMAGAGAFMLAERLERPSPPGWRIRWPAKAARILAAASGTTRYFPDAVRLRGNGAAYHQMEQVSARLGSAPRR